VRALVIDDSRVMRRIVAGILEGLGFEVQQAGHGREGLDVLNGGIADEGRRQGVPTPLHDAMVALVHGLESSW